MALKVVAEPKSSTDAAPPDWLQRLGETAAAREEDQPPFSIFEQDVPDVLWAAELPWEVRLARGQEGADGPAHGDKPARSKQEEAKPRGGQGHTRQGHAIAAAQHKPKAKAKAAADAAAQARAKALAGAGLHKVPSRHRPAAPPKRPAQPHPTSPAASLAPTKTSTAPRPTARLHVFRIWQPPTVPQPPKPQDWWQVAAQPWSRLPEPGPLAWPTVPRSWRRAWPALTRQHEETLSLASIASVAAAAAGCYLFARLVRAALAKANRPPAQTRQLTQRPLDRRRMV